MTDQAPSQLIVWAFFPLSRFVPSWFKAMFLGARTARKMMFDDDKAALGKDRPTGLPSAVLVGVEDARPSKQDELIDVIMPQSHFLKRQVSAPASAEGSLNAVAQLDLQRKTPFQPADVRWILGAKRKSGTQIITDQWIAKKSDVDQWENHLEDTGLRVRKFFVAGAESYGPIADFTAEVAPNAGRWRMSNGLLVLAILGFGAVSWLYPAWALGPQIRALNTQTGALRDQALTLRPQIEELRAYDSEKSAFLDLINRRALLSEAVRELTVALPDTVWLETMTFSADRLVFGGEAQQSAPELVLSLAKSVHFHNPRLTGPVANTSTGAERFEITLNLGAAK